MSGVIVSSTPDESMDVSLNKTNTELNFLDESDTSAFGGSFSEVLEKRPGNMNSGTAVEVGGTAAEDGGTAAEDGDPVAEEPPSAKPSGSKSTPHNNPNWLETMQQNFDQVIIQACSEATKAAVAANKKIEVIYNEYAMMEYFAFYAVFL